MNNPWVLIVEDEQSIVEFLSAALKNYYNILAANNGKKAIEIVKEKKPNLILLDLGLPDIDGIQVLKEIRAFSNVPIIVVSAREKEEEKVNALDSGADDYITKPFGNKELLARIRRIFRQNNLTSPSYQLKDFHIDYNKRLVTMFGDSIHLTPIEFQILELLSRNVGKVLTHEQIISKIWGPYESDNQILRVNMANVRRKIEKNPADPEYILTEVGVGYRMADIEDFPAD